MSLRTRVVGACWLIFWVLMATVELQDYVRGGGREYWKPVLWQCSSAIVITILLLIQRRVMKRYDRFLSRPARWFALQIVWLPLYWIIFTPSAFAIRHGVYALLGEQYTHLGWAEVMVYEAIKLSLYYLIFVVVLFGVLSYDALQAEKEQAELVNRTLREMQLHRLTQQIQPHFLFNTLNTISQIMHVDVQRADAILVQLADVLRSTLAFGDLHETTLAEELRFVRAYANLMCERFAGRVEISWQIDTAVETCKIPVMSLQPLLENIFKHTVEQRRQKTRITIGAQRDGEFLLLRLDDDIGQLLQKPEGKGIGVKNLRTRLQTLYGERASLTLIQLQPAGVRAEMRLPCVC